MKLSEKIVAALALAAGKTERVESDDDTTGLYFRMRRNGQGKIKRSWFFRYAGGKPSVDYPAYNLVAARTWAGQMQAKVRLGGDPAQERREGKDRAAVTMGATLPAYFDHKRALMRPRSFEQVQRHLGKNFAPLHRHPMTSIKLAIVAARVTAIVAGNGPTEAKNSLRSVHAFFMWASRRGLISSNPAIGVELPPDRKRSRVLNADELAAVWRATDGGGDFDAIIRLLLLTGCRMSEIGGLCWSEIRSDRIVLPAARVKNGREHVVPLAASTRAILDARPRRPGRDQVFGRNERGYVGWSSAKRKLDARLPTMPAWSLHDLRRSFVTGCCELGIGPHVVESAVNHVSGHRGGVAGNYNWSVLEEPVRRCMAAWERHVLDIADGRVAGDRVVPLRAATL